MEPALSIEEFLRDPIERYLVGHSFLIWVYSPSLAGSVYFGRPDERDFPTLLGLFELARHPRLRPPFDVLVDGSELEGLNAESFRHLSSYVDTAQSFAPLIRRIAMVRPAGMTGATVAGLFYDVARSERFHIGLFTDRAEAFRWLDNRDGVAGEAALEATLASVRGLPPLLRALRDWLRTHLHAPQLQAAARALGHSERSLQRRLDDLGTQFRAEVTRARLREAEALLTDGDTKLEAIARTVGCASASQFAAMFRRHTGETPSDFRQRRRRTR